MAAVGRTDETQIVNDNVYDNNAKEIDPAMVRAVLQSLIESNFNIVDDVLKNMNYDTGVTLANFLAKPLWGATGDFDISGFSGSISGSSGIVSSATASVLSSSDSEITINFSEDISDRKISVNIFTSSSLTIRQNDVCAPVIRIVNGTTIKVGLREVSVETQSIRLEIIAFKTA